MSIHVAAVRLELQVPGARSLKDKRRAVKSLVDRMHHRFRVSVAETGLHDLAQRAEIGLAVVAASERDLDRILDELRRLAEDSSEALLTSWELLGDDDEDDDDGDDRDDATDEREAR